MKRTHSWSHGILLVMFGIVVGILGLMLALMQVGSWWLAMLGGGIITFGIIIASRAKIDRSVPANEKRIPSARVQRSSQRRSPRR